MAYILENVDYSDLINKLKDDYVLIGPKRVKGVGKFSDTDLITYGPIADFAELELQEKSTFSAKEVLFPPSQTLLYFTEDEFKEPKHAIKKRIIFLRTCDFNAIKRLDLVFLNSGGSKDPYYQTVREQTSFFVIGCEQSFTNCFCVSLESNKCSDFDGYFNFKNDQVMCFVSEEFDPYFALKGEQVEVEPQFIEENQIKVDTPQDLDKFVHDLEFWQEYGKRCIGCGKCNFVCPTCSCFTMQDIFYRDNANVGERRRVWASCQVDGFTDMAGGHSCRSEQGQRMRFKVMHKIKDFKDKFGIHMCVGCGRCDDNCPEYISFSKCINKLSQIEKGGNPDA